MFFPTFILVYLEKVTRFIFIIINLGKFFLQIVYLQLLDKDDELSNHKGYRSQLQTFYDVMNIYFSSKYECCGKFLRCNWIWTLTMWSNVNSKPTRWKWFTSEPPFKIESNMKKSIRIQEHNWKWQMRVWRRTSDGRDKKKCFDERCYIWNIEISCRRILFRG